MAGLVMERTRGAVVDNLGLVGNSSRALQRNFEAPWQQALALRAPDLVLITLGANEVSHGHLGPPQRQRFALAYRDVFRRIRGTRPSPACLVTSVLDAPLREPAAVLSAQAEARRAQAMRVRIRVLGW
jgi:lysophospholipase L1-like esterase